MSLNMFDGSGSDGTKPLPEPMLIQIDITICRQIGHTDLNQ